MFAARTVYSVNIERPNYIEIQHIGHRFPSGPTPPGNWVYVTSPNFKNRVKPGKRARIIFRYYGWKNQNVLNNVSPEDWEVIGRVISVQGGRDWPVLVEVGGKSYSIAGFMIYKVEV